MNVQYKQSEDIAAVRSLVQQMYRQLGLLQRDEICCAGVTVPQCYALQALAQEGELTSSELAERLGVDPSSATRAADVLVKNGHVERTRPETGDRRRVILRLTEQGRQLTEQLMEAGDGFFSRLLSNFTTEERHNVVRVLERLTSALTETAGCCRPFEPAENEPAPRRNT